ncbi:MAG: hypothetical protein GQ531_00515 [Sulfurovum sp.]|nr:hypothetical protein [Sulfurovum sp.]
MSKMFNKFSAVLLVLAVTAVSAQAAKISAYYSAPYASAKTVKSKLGKAGFKVLAAYSPASKSHLKVFVITNSKLKANAAKKTRGFAAIQRVMVDSKAKTVLATNPTYWLKAFMQKDYKAGVDSSVKASLGKALGKLTATKDVLSAGDLSGYHFMMGMPYYQDMLKLKGKAGVDIKGKKKIFELKLANGSKLVGVTMGKTTETFVDKIGADKAILLPYTVLIEGDKAYALHAKYYIALSYPLLSMGQFMVISSIPDAIERKLKKTIK